MVVVGTDGFKSNLKILTVDEHRSEGVRQFSASTIHKALVGPDGKFTSVKYIQKHRSSAFIVGSDRGTIMLFDYGGDQSDPVFVEELNAHQGEITRFALSADKRFLVSAGTDGAIFIYSISE